MDSADISTSLDIINSLLKECDKHLLVDDSLDFKVLICVEITPRKEATLALLKSQLEFEQLSYMVALDNTITHTSDLI
jgi:hypothetical protein